MISARAATTSCLLASVAVGSSIAVTPLIVGYPVFAGQAARYAVAAVVLLAVLGRLDPAHAGRRLTPRQVVRLLLAAATGSAGFNVLLIAASGQADPAAIGAVVGASPVVLAMLGAPRVDGRLPRPRPRVLAGALLASAGVVVLQGAGHSTGLGLLLATGVLACEVAFTLVAAPLLPVLGAARVSAWNCAAAAVMLAAAASVSPEPPRLPTSAEGSTLLYQALVMTAVAFVLWYRGVARLGPDRAGVTMAAAPLAAAVLAAVIGTGTLTTRTLAGAVLVAAGVTVAVRTPARSPALVAWGPARPWAGRPSGRVSPAPSATSWWTSIAERSRRGQADR